MRFTYSFNGNGNLIHPELLHAAAGCRLMSKRKLRWNAISLHTETLFKGQTMRECRGAGGVREGCSATDFHIKSSLKVV